MSESVMSEYKDPKNYNQTDTPRSDLFSSSRRMELVDEAMRNRSETAGVSVPSETLSTEGEARGDSFAEQLEDLRYVRDISGYGDRLAAIRSSAHVTNPRVK